MSALPILELKENSPRILTSNFNKVLSKVGDRPFVLISINGATRTGKSHALNYFIRYLTFKSGAESSSSSTKSWTELENAPMFVARGGRTRTTQGIDLWSEPFIFKVDGREVAVLLMDCQGLFDEQSTGTQNAIIFSLSSLCSSMSVFNVMRNIDESILQQIHFFSDYATLVTRKKGKAVEENENQEESNKDEDEDQNDPDTLQRLIFLVRDFEFEDAYGYHGDTSKSKSRSESESAQESDQNFCMATFYSSRESLTPPENRLVREEILRCYKNVGCYLMPHPGKKFIKDQSTPVDEDFGQYMQEFVELVLSPEQLATKRIGGQEITGNDFKKFIGEWEKLCKKAGDHFPAVQTIGESTAIMQNTLALKTAFSHYEKVMSNFGQLHPAGLSDSDFLQLHEQLKKEAVALFNSIKKLGGEELSAQFLESLKESMGKRCEGVQQLNLILRSKAETDVELKKNEERLSEVQNQMKELQIQRQQDLEATAWQLKFHQEQLTAAQNQYSRRLAAMEKKQEEGQKEVKEALAKQEKERRERAHWDKLGENVLKFLGTTISNAPPISVNVHKHPTPYKN